MKKLILFFLLTFLFLFHACNTENPNIKSNIDRPHDPWVFRSVLDRIPRVITVALHDKMWLAYSTQHTKLYKAWRGSVNFEGPVYDHAHGPQPTSIGDAYLKNELSSPWKLYRGAVELSNKVAYKGHRFEADKVFLMYQISADNSVDIEIEEQPSAIEDEAGNMTLHRDFKVSGLPTGVKLVYSDELTSIVVKEHINSDGNLVYEEVEEINKGQKQFEDVRISLNFEKDGTAHLSSKFYDATILDPNIQEEEIASDAPLGVLYISKHGCKTCHNKDLKTIGPAYRAIAERYADTDENRVMLVAKVKAGGSGKWGKQVMNAHPEVPDADLKDMIDYILGLGDPINESEGQEKEGVKLEPVKVNAESLIAGATVRVYDIPSGTASIPQNLTDKNVIQAGIMPNFDNVSGGDFKNLTENFALHAQGYFKAEKDGIYKMRLWSDDGSKLKLNGELLIDHDGLHGTSMKEVSLNLSEGYYKFELEFFQGLGGKFLSWNYKSGNEDTWKIIPTRLIFHAADDHSLIGNLKLPMANTSKIPGDRAPLLDVHPSFDLTQARPTNFEPKVGGLDFMSDGSMIISTWDPDGAVYRLSNLDAKNPDDIKVMKIAIGLAEPLGVSVVDDEIYVMQKQELTHLVDYDGDGIIDQFNTVCDDWGVSSNFHEFGFGLEYKDGKFYAALATAIEPGGASTNPQIKDRGKAISIDKITGEIEYIAHGLRTPNGVGRGYKDEIFIADNQGDWLPSSKIVHVSEGAWFGSRSVDFELTEGLEETKPVVWLPQDEIGNSPSTPSYINIGPYKNQMIHGEVTHGGVKRVFVEEINGKLQGCVFRFIQGLEAGVNRLRWRSDKELFIGGIGNPGNWQQNNKLWYGIQKLSYNDKVTFEMLAVRARSNGLEIEFTEKLNATDGWNVDDFEIMRWWYKPTIEYGGPKLDLTEMKIKSSTVIEGGGKVFLEFDGIIPNHVYYVRIKNKFVSELDHSLWSTEAWYTMNEVPQIEGVVRANPDPMAINALSKNEIEQGWELLFNGKDMQGWRNFKKKTIGPSWVIDDGAIHLKSELNDEGRWDAPDGGDIVTNETYKDFELKLEWKIGNCGNSGIMFNVSEDEKYCCPFWTGPEMQVLDNTCHPDSRYVTHRAGDLYDMISSKYETANPAGEWNKARIKSVNGEVAFWLNGYKIVEFNMMNEMWTAMIADSKFNEMEGFGTHKEGHICLQDHNDKVWYRNIKIRRL